MRPTYTRALLGLLAAALVAACAPAPAPAAEAVAIAFAVPDDLAGAFAPLAERFHAEHLDVRVRVVPLPRRAEGGDVALRAAVEGGDVALVPSSLVQTAPAPGTLLRDLAPLMDADATFARGDLYPGAILRDRAGGQIVALQQRVAPPLLFYNRDLFRAAGVAEPQPGWGWDAILAAAEQVARPGGERPVYGFMGAWGSLAEPLAAVFGAAEIDLTAEPAALRLDTPEAAAAIARLTALVAAGAVYQHPPDDPQVESSELARLIGEGRVAMWTQQALVGETGPWVGAASYPPLPLPGDEPLFSLVVSAGTAHPEAAWRWASFLSRQDLDLAGGVGLGPLVTAPALRTAGTTGWEALEGRLGITGLGAAARAALEQPAPEQVASQAARQALQRAAVNVIAGRQTPEEALAAAQELMGELSREMAGAAGREGGAGVVVSPPAGPPEAGPGVTAITFVTWGDASVYTALAERFGREHPDIAVAVQEWQFPPGSSSMGLADLAEGADCLAWGALPAPADRGLVRDLRPLMDADPRFERDDFPRALLDIFAAEGAIYALPAYFRAEVLHYNADLFAAAGLSAPDAGWGVADLLAAAARLTDRAAGQYGFASLGYQPYDLLFMLDRLGARPAGAAGEGVSFTEPRTLEALGLYRDLIRSSAPVQRLEGYTAWAEPPGGGDLVAAGRVAMWFDDTRRGPPPEDEERPFTYRVAPRPLGDGPVSGLDLTEVGGLFITAATPHPEACWRWISFLTEQSAGLNEAGLLPARDSVATSEAFRAGRDAGELEVDAAYRAALDRGLARGGAEALIASGADLYWLGEAVDRALQGGDLERELAEAEARTTAYLACLDGGAEALGCARAADPDYNGQLLMFGR